MSRISPVIHDGQGDAMPCQCPACCSPFIKRPRLALVPAKTDDRTDRAVAVASHLREARAC